MKTSQIIVLALVGLIAVGVCVIAGILLLRQPGAEATPTAVAEVTEAPAIPSDTPDSGMGADDSWDRVQAAGKLVVGTAADYPPFESYVGPGQIDGFDIALMDEIGRRLGVQIEYRDFAFDGLGPSLTQGEIDAAIAAISRTPEREALLDFTNVYLVAEDGVLAREDSSITIDNVDELAAYKVGVQRSTVYQEWFQTTQIETGRMSPDSLFAYERAEDAIRDLREDDLEGGVARLEVHGAELGPGDLAEEAELHEVDRRGGPRQVEPRAVADAQPAVGAGAVPANARPQVVAARALDREGVLQANALVGDEGLDLGGADALHDPLPAREQGLLAHGRDLEALEVALRVLLGLDPGAHRGSA